MATSKWNPRAALERIGQDRTLLQHMIEIFSEDAIPLLSELRAQLKEADFDEACRTAHSIKGLAMNFDGAQCVAAAEHIEDRCRLHDGGDYETDLNQLSTSIEELMQQLKSWV